VLIM